MDRLERLTDLVLVLLDTKRPLTLIEIAGSVAGYPAAEAAQRQAFERDKRTLREQGIVVTVESLPDEPTIIGYRIRPEEYYLPALGLLPDEQVALNLAVAGVHLDDSTAHGALLKLGVLERDAPVAMTALPSLPALAVLHEALRSHTELAFDYRGEARRVDPHALVFRRGWWYLVGLDHGRAEQRTFRVDRMAAVRAVGPPGGFEPPPAVSYRSGLDQAPWRFGSDELGEARVWVDAIRAEEVVAQLGADALVERREDGSVVVSLPVANVDAFRSWVIGLLDHSVVLGPAKIRKAVVDWLKAAARPPRSRSARSGGSRPTQVSRPGSQPEGPD
ncbi:MAG: helix-turn-helix transcriptional regulator [Acidimicrobiales bacterium]